MGENARFKNGHARVETRIFGLQILLEWILVLGGYFFVFFLFFSVSGVSETVLTELQTDGAREAMKGK